MVLGRRPLTPQAAIPFITSHLQSDDKGLRPAVYDACAEVVKESRRSRYFAIKFITCISQH